MEAFILAGGLGTRLIPAVSDRAKPVAEVDGRPFLSYVLDRLERASIVEGVTLCVGHKAESVRAVLGERHGRLALRYSMESSPLGTGGALRHALTDSPATGALAMNGDTFFDVDLDALAAFHAKRGAVATVALARVEDTARYGAVELDGERIARFTEKGGIGPGLVNAGVYVLSAAAVARVREGPVEFSFEQRMLAPWSAAGEVCGVACEGRFIDIGTPADYARAGAVVGEARPC